MIDRRAFLFATAKAVILASAAGSSRAFAEIGILHGQFFDYPVEGLEYRAEPSGLSGKTQSDGGFHYREGDKITFSLGGLPLGTVKAAPWITPLDLVPEALGDIANTRLVNIAMLIQSLNARGQMEDGIELSPKVHRAVKTHADALKLDQPNADFFALLNDVIIPQLIQADGLEPATGGPIKGADETGKRRARSPEMVRNQLRRTKAGIMRITDLTIPLREDNPCGYLLGTLHLPVGPQVPAHVPLVMNLGVYGKDKIFGSICTPDQLQAQEIVEDRFRSGNLDHLSYENHETVDTFVWVPAGYAVLRVDEAGIGRSPGKLSPWSHTTAHDYVDVIHWAGAQPWSNGNVGTIGISYYAMTQWQMAAQAAGVSALKAIIPWEGGVDTYRDDMYPGGLFLKDFFRMWSFINSRNHCGPPVVTPQMKIDFLQRWIDAPFYDPAVWGEYRADLSKVTVPFLSAAGLDNMSLHPRGNVMAFRLAAAKDKLLRLNTGSHLKPFYSKDGVADQMAFFDYWLRNRETGIMTKPRVKMAVKTGDARKFYWSYANDFPLPQTRYVKLYLNATPEKSGFKVEGPRQVYQLHPSADVVTANSNSNAHAPKKAARAIYSAVVKPVIQIPGPPPPRFNRQQSPHTYGISFATPLLKETMTLAGYAKLVTWVSSSTEDMDLHLSLRIYDEKGAQLVYSTDDDERIDLPEIPPIQQGRLKVSHRKLDPAESTFFQPVQTHLKADAQPLKPDEIVQVEIEFWPLTAEIRKGHRIVLDVQPYHGEGHAWPQEYGAYNTGTNTLYTGPDHVSYLQLPVVGTLPQPQDAERWSVS